MSATVPESSVEVGLDEIRDAGRRDYGRLPRPEFAFDLDDLGERQPAPTEVLELYPDDALVIVVPHELTIDECQLLQAQWEAALPGRRAIVLAGGAHLRVLRSRMKEGEDAAGSAASPRDDPKAGA